MFFNKWAVYLHLRLSYFQYSKGVLGYERVELEPEQRQHECEHQGYEQQLCAACLSIY